MMNSGSVGGSSHAGFTGLMSAADGWLEDLDNQ